MTRHVRLDREADAEVDVAVAWYERQLEGLGLQLLDEIENAKQRIGDAPRSYPHVHEVTAELGARQAQVRRFPYLLVYVELDEEIRVLALAHARRRPGYWRRRVSEKRPSRPRRPR